MKIKWTTIWYRKHRNFQKQTTTVSFAKEVQIIKFKSSSATATISTTAPFTIPIKRKRTKTRRPHKPKQRTRENKMFKILNLENKILKHYNMRNNICHVLQNTIQLTKTKKTVLSLGLKFIPQTKTNSQTLHDTLMKSLHDYHRNIALNIFLRRY